MLGIFQEPLPSGTTDQQDHKLDPKLLLLTPRPRVVKVGWPIRVQILVGISLFAMFGLWFNEVIQSFKTATVVQLAAPLFILLCLAAGVSVVIIKDLRELRLLQYGNCVMGRVVGKIKAGGRGRRKLIVYQFAVGPGKPMTAKGADYNSCSVNSPALVFFDPDRLERNVAICCTGWRVCDESGRPIEP